MSLHRRAARRDASEPEIRRLFEAAGWSWQPLSIEGGPDALVGAYGVVLLTVECKTGTAKLRASQEVWHANWKGPKPSIVRTAEEAMAVIRYYALGRAVRSVIG